MKIANLTLNSGIYTCNSYLVTGDFNSMDDVNTLIDTKIMDRIWSALTGVGKKIVETLGRFADMNIKKYHGHGTPIIK